MPIPKRKKGEKKDDFVSRCMGNPVMREYDQEQRYAICQDQSKRSNGNKNMKNLYFANLKFQSKALRTKTIDGIKYNVYPVTMLVEGVHHGMVGGPTLYRNQVLMDSASSWENIPITIDHPQAPNGELLSANSTEHDTKIVGFVRDISVNDGKLTAKAYVNIEKAKQYAPDIEQKINQGLEVSTGLFALMNQMEGTFNGEDFVEEVIEMQPDHLALLPTSVGACSINDGCGLQANKDKKLLVNFTHNSTTTTGEPSWGSVDKTKLPRIAHADHGEAENKSTWKYPHHFIRNGGGLNDKGVFTTGTMFLHKGGLNAAWAAANGARSGQEATGAVKSHLNAHRRALRIQESITNIDVNQEPEEYLKQITNTINDYGEDQYEDALSRKLEANAKSFSQIGREINIWLDNQDVHPKNENDNYQIHFLEDLFSDHFIYRIRSRNSEKLEKRSYSVNNQNQVVINDDPISVYKQISYVEQKANEETMKDKKKCCPDRVAALISNAASKFTEDDSEWLSNLTADQLVKLEAQVEVKPEGKANTTNQTDDKEKTTSPTKKTFNDWITSAPPEVQAVVNAGLRELGNKRTTLIQTILANKNNTFSEETLKAFTVEQLEPIAALAAVPVEAQSANFFDDYSGQIGAFVPQANQSEEEPYIMPGLAPVKKQ